ncbi:MAG: MBL fold metallo-hydrolase [Actinomyces sp.]|nr:MAG: MBL fold metallo-hydrolase [Actinomyces sp.]
MKFVQHYLDCLSHASYFIGDETTGRAVVVDPQRDIDEYVRDAEELGMRIEWVIETHFHADFLSGHLELAAATGARIGFGPGAEPEFDAHIFSDGERISLGEVTLEIRHTPGHTPESISIVVYDSPDALPGPGDEQGRPWGVLTGDTLFVGDVGRPDLLASIGYTREELAAMLYDSLRTKLLTLPDETRVWPAHGAGSACGKNLSTETSSTIGEQKRTNYALQPMSREEFIAAVSEGQPAAPGYFVYDAVLNRRRRDLLEPEAPPALSVDQVLEAVADGAVVLDTRDAEHFAAGHLAGSINVGLDGRFAEYAGSVVEPGTPIVLVAEPLRETEARIRLARIGFDTVVGHLADLDLVKADRPELIQRATRLDAEALVERLRDGDIQLVDVRNPGETALGVIPGAVTIPLAQLRGRVDELDPARATVVYCAGGYRSSVGASLLRYLSFADVADLEGGYGAWQQVAAPVQV